MNPVPPPTARRRADRAAALSLCLLLFLTLGGCSLLGPEPGARHSASSTVEFLYPGMPDLAAAPATPRLTLPLRLGIAFVPGAPGSAHDPAPGRAIAFNPKTVHSAPAAAALTENVRLDLMDRVAGHFRGERFIRSIELMPPGALQPGGGFANLDRLRALYGIDVIALVSYDQVQFTDRGALSLAYWTIIGAYVAPGERNDTQTLLDTAVIDIPSRKLLFRASGSDRTGGRATLVNATEQLRQDSLHGFEAATRQMIENLERELERFKKRIKDQPSDIEIVQTAEWLRRTTADGLAPAAAPAPSVP